MELALDFAVQAAPDHPEVKRHPEWFRHRPDGTIQYAENPPKKYQDIVPFDFETDAWQSLWEHLRDVVLFWVDQGVRIFRVDNPHTKPFAFWEWLIAGIKADHPDVLFLAEAFTRPKVMYRLAKAGFTQSYTYFTWRNTAADLEEYVTELTTTGLREFFQPNFWPNTPDILHADLQRGGQPMFQARLVLAATLSSSFGIYGPAFELGVNTPKEAGSEEYLDSEKYEQKLWDLELPDSLAPVIAALNRARREHRALQSTDDVRFLEVDNEGVLAYVRAAPGDALLVVVSLDAHEVARVSFDVPLEPFGLPPGGPFEAVDLLTGTVRPFATDHVQMQIDPADGTAMVLVLRPSTAVAKRAPAVAARPRPVR